jgi:hypothetical protein
MHRTTYYCTVLFSPESWSVLSSNMIVLFRPRPRPCRPCPRRPCPRRCRPPRPCCCPPRPCPRPPRPRRHPPRRCPPRRRRRLFVIVCLSRHCGGARLQHSSGGGCRVDSCRHRAADTLPPAANDAALPKSCCCCRCRRRRHTATALSAAVLPRITPRCHRQPPPPGCHYHAADTAAALQPPPPCCSRSPPPSTHFQLFGGRQYIVKKTSRHQRLNRLTSINVDFVRPDDGDVDLKRRISAETRAKISWGLVTPC